MDPGNNFGPWIQYLDSIDPALTQIHIGSHTPANTELLNCQAIYSGLSTVNSRKRGGDILEKPKVKRLVRELPLKWSIDDWHFKASKEPHRYKPGNIVATLSTSHPLQPLDLDLRQAELS